MDTKTADHQMNSPKTDSEYQGEAERLAREAAIQSASLRFPHKKQNAAKVYIEETTKVILDTIPYLASLLRAQDERDSIGVRWYQEQAKCIQLRAENDALKLEVLRANDAAAKGEEGRKLGTALEEAVKENAALKAELSETRKALSEYGATLDQLWEMFNADGMPLVDHVKNLRAELASLKTVGRAAHKGQSDFKNYYPERGYSTDASDYDSRSERLKKNIRDLDEALTNHTAKYKLE